MFRCLSLTLALLPAAALAMPSESAVPAATFAAAPVPVFARAESGAGVIRAALSSGATAPLPAYRAIDSLMAAPRPVAGRAPNAAELGLQLPGGKGASGAKEPAKAPDDDDDDDDEAPSARPGSFSGASTKIPSAFLKTRTVAPHTGAPDVSYDVNDKTTIGLFGDLNHTSRTDTRSALSKPDRELGAGFTFQYKFGSH